MEGQRYDHSDPGSADASGQPEVASGQSEVASRRQLSVIQVVRSDAFAGVERYMCQVSNGLARRGHHMVVVGGDPDRMRSELSGGIEFVPATTVARAARVLANHRGVDVVHAHMTAAEAAAWLARPLQRSPIVATRHFAEDRGSGTLARMLTHITTRALARDIAISQFVADSVSGPTVLLYSAVPDRPQASLDSPTVLMLQRMTAEKSPEVGIRAWAASGLGAEGWRLVVAGVGDRSVSMTTLAHQLGVTDSVEFVGQIADTDKLLDETSVVLATAPAEPFGLSVVEAMSHGVPVVAADGGAHTETVGDDGLVFPVGDAQAAAKELVSLAQDPARRQKVGGALRDRQQRMFSLEQHLDGLELIYRQVLEERGRG
jgi:glycosyltransferase involved in cell wall biosynthesis